MPLPVVMPYRGYQCCEFACGGNRNMKLAPSGVTNTWFTPAERNCSTALLNCWLSAPSDPGEPSPSVKVNSTGAPQIGVT